MSEELYDVIIIGGGPAGLTASIYTSRQGLRTLIIERKQLGGRAWGPHTIENFPGFPMGINGTDLMEKFISQSRKFGVEFKEETFVGLTDMGEAKMVMTRKGIYLSKAVILTIGLQRKSLSLPGETEYKGRGVCYCAICDGPFFKDMPVAVVGAGKEAVEDALTLSRTSSKVYAIPGSKGYGEGFEEELEELAQLSNVEILEGTDIASIEGEDVVTGLTLKNGPTGKLDVNGVFLILENVGTGSMIKDAGIETDTGGCIQVDENQETNLKGIYAAGDCACSGMQVVTAAGDGGKAGLAAFRFVRSLKS
ncbi:MAG TPA: FAD-dependent oxidoreductase [Patescibacteria group bacterium]|nr:FAD-dependent oxidoreductase [Patescibacteria group bacterium]